MGKKEQTNGGSQLIIGEFSTDEDKEIKMPPEKAKKLTIMSIEKLKELNEKDYLEIDVGYHEAFKEGEKIVKRIASNGKKLTPKMKANELESR